jgi:Matrixin
MIRRPLAAWLAVFLLLVSADPALAYLKLGFDMNGQSFILKWPRSPAQYFVSSVGVPGVTPNDFQAAVSRAFATWQAVPTASIAFQFGGYTSNLPGEDDGRSTLGFLDQPQLDRVLASTSFLVDAVTGELVESDIFFNSAFPWSVAPRGEQNRWDLESIALHEIGHFNGLGHSALGETEMANGARRVLSAASVMFPIALGAGDVSMRTLRPDDIAGISDLYPDAGFNDTTGSVSGKVTKNGSGVFGAHVVAFDIARGEMVANFTLRADGQFSIAGLQPGPHLLRVEPLDDADLDSFFEPEDPVDISFRIKYHERLVIVPKGSDSGAVQITVAPK